MKPLDTMYYAIAIAATLLTTVFLVTFIGYLHDKWTGKIEKDKGLHGFIVSYAERKRRLIHRLRNYNIWFASKKNSLNTK